MIGVIESAALHDLRDQRLAPEDDAAQRLALLAAVAAGGSGPAVRLVRPEPTAAFSRRDALLPGYAAARTTAERHGFAPVVRPVGGRLAVQHRGCLVLDLVGRADDAVTGTTARFEAAAGVVVAALSALHVEAGTLDVRVGPVPREYCPGEHSVNLGGRVKVAGTAQRQVRGAWLVSVLVVVEDAAPLRALTRDAYADLGLDVDPATVVAVADHAPGATTDRVGDLLLAALGTLTAAGQPPGRVAP